MIQEFFRSNNIDTHVEALLTLHIAPFGAKDETEELIRFRNDFAHGSFSALIEDINHHYFMLDRIAHQILGLYKQPVITSIDGSWYLWDRAWVPIDTKIGLEHTEGALYIPSKAATEQLLSSKEGAESMEPLSYMPLSPLYHVFNQEVLANSFAKVSVKDLYYTSIVSAWTERYTREKERTK